MQILYMGSDELQHGPGKNKKRDFTTAMLNTYLAKHYGRREARETLSE